MFSISKLLNGEARECDRCLLVLILEALQWRAE